MKLLLSVLFVVGTSSLVQAQNPSGDDPNLSKNYDGQYADTYVGIPDKSKSQAVPCPTCSRDAAKIMDATTFGQEKSGIPSEQNTEGRH